jgi:16S rRNA (uracil1498-N3)-methyltransferase
VTPPVFFYDVAGVSVGDVVLLGGDEGRHAADVRRLRVGEEIWLTEGRGTRVAGVVAAVRRGELTVEVRDRRQVPAPEPVLVVAQALARGGRDEQAVEAMTEVGVDHVIGWSAERAVAKWTDRTAARWAATSRAAAKQARRVWWPTVSGPVSTADLAARCRGAELVVVLHESAETPIASLTVPPRGEVMVVVGPEGGVTDHELAQLSAAGPHVHVVRLGPTILRSSTAGVAALAVLSAATRWH